MITRIHVNQHHIKRNDRNRNSDLPVVTVKDYKQNRTTNCARLMDQNGVEVARIVYSREKPLPCGARVWIETELQVETD